YDGAVARCRARDSVCDRINPDRRLESWWQHRRSQRAHNDAWADQTEGIIKKDAPRPSLSPLTKSGFRTMITERLRDGHSAQQTASQAPAAAWPMAAPSL